MADTEPKTELPTDVLAPVDVIREELVSTAVKFLQNPKVSQSPLSQKKAFLQKKGLTNEEVNVAIERSGVSQSVEQPATKVTDAHSGTVVAGLGQSPGLPQKYQDSIEVSSWYKARDVMAVVTMVTGISYIAYKAYKDYLSPWLFGYQTAEKRLSALEKNVAESISNVNTSLESIEKTLGKQQEKLQMMSHDINSKSGGETVTNLQSHHSISEIKTEISSIKGLLLNRRQFPPVPTTTPVLPAWQLASNAGDADNCNEKGTSDSAASTPKVTFSTSPTPESPAQVTNDTSLIEKENEDSLQLLSEDSTPVVAKNIENEADNIENEADNIENEADNIETKADKIESEVDKIENGVVNQNEAQLSEVTGQNDYSEILD